ncbi:MAG: hypothetical protein WD008_00015 [Balneolaceae bacterium]
MWILTLFLALVFFAGSYIGTQSWFTLDRLNRSNVLNGALIVLMIFTMLMVAYVLGFFPQSVAAPFMMTLYSVIAGFFIGYAYRLYNYRTKAGRILYQHRSFWIDHAPNFLAMILIIYGVYRMAILTNEPVTGIRLTSGLSLICFGLFNWTLKVVPEFRSKSVILLDRSIRWIDIISWKWQSESVLKLEFIHEDPKHGERLAEFSTSIPEDERKEIEIVLKSKMEEFADERKKKLLKED